MGKGCENVRRGRMQILRERKGKESMKIEGSRDEIVKQDGRRKRKSRSALCFLNMSKAPGLIRLSHGATGGICSV